MAENETQNTKSMVSGVVITLIILLVMVGFAWYFQLGTKSPSLTGEVTVPKDGQGAQTAPNSTKLQNTKYGFEITAPAGATPETFFKNYSLLSDSWRMNAPTTGSASKGMALLAIPIIRIEQNDSGPAENKSYPLNLAIEVRVGVSSSTADCYKKDEGYSNQKVSDVAINGISFKKFSFGDAAMMKYVQGESYRTVHNGLCYAIEQIKTGSSYREPGMEEALTEEGIAQYYSQAEQTVKTFKFL